jgi:tannase/feruloyl esterase
MRQPNAAIRSAYCVPSCLTLHRFDPADLQPPQPRGPIEAELHASIKADSQNEYLRSSDVLVGNCWRCHARCSFIQETSMQKSMGDKTELVLTRNRHLLTASVASALLAACGGSDNDGPTTDSFTTPLVVASAPAACAALAGRTIAAADIGEPTTGAVVTSATYNMAVADAPNAGNTAIVAGTPDHCQTLIDIKPVDPTAPVIKAQVNLPTSWNGKSLQMGGGGLNGVLVTGLGRGRADGPELQLPLTRGFVTLGTDSGHQTPGGAFALNNEAFTNYAYASYKKTRDVGVQLGLAFYGHRALKSYYMGGSEGGREGMIMAQRYPTDFDGIVAIDPVIRLIGLWQYQLSFGQVQSTPGSWIGGKVQLIHDTVQATCDALDGITDQVVSNYRACKPLADAALAAKRCVSGTDEGPACFSDAQLATIRWTYSGQLFPFALANGIYSYPGYFYGSEGVPGGLSTWVTGTTAPTSDPDVPTTSRSYSLGGTFVRYFVTKDPTFNPLAFNSAAFQTRIQELSNVLDMTNPDLSAFHAHGGKLILRENLSDKGNSPQTGFDYYDAVVAKMGKTKVDEFFVAYGATGLPHTSIGLNAGTANAPTYGTPGQIDFVSVLDDWVAKGIKPAESLTLTLRTPLPPYDLVSSKPMCRYGSYPRYTGATPAEGNLASNYVCTVF